MLYEMRIYYILPERMVAIHNINSANLFTDEIDTLTFQNNFRDFNINNSTNKF